MSATYLEIQSQKSARALQQRLDPLLVGFLVFESRRDHIGPDSHALRYSWHEPLLVWVGIVECGKQERPLGLDSDVKTQKLTQLRKGLLDGRFFAGPAVADADTDLEGSFCGIRKDNWLATCDDT